jgi:hypothetical protein
MESQTDLNAWRMARGLRAFAVAAGHPNSFAHYYDTALEMIRKSRPRNEPAAPAGLRQSELLRQVEPQPCAVISLHPGTPGRD